MADKEPNKAAAEKLHKVITDQNVEIGDFDTFYNKLKADDGVDRLVSVLEKNNIDIGSVDDVSKKLYSVSGTTPDLKKKGSTELPSDGGSSGLLSIKFGGEDYEVNPTTQEVFKGGKPVTVPQNIKDYIAKNIIGVPDNKPKYQAAPKAPDWAAGTGTSDAISIAANQPKIEQQGTEITPDVKAVLQKNFVDTDIFDYGKNPALLEQTVKDLSDYTGTDIDLKYPETLDKAIGQAKMIRDAGEFKKLATSAGVTEQRALDIAYDNAADKFLDGGDKELWALTKQVNQAFEGGDKATVDKLMPMWEKARKQFIDTRHDKITSLHNMIITGKNVDGLPLTSAAIEDLKKEKNLLTKQLNGFFKSPEAVVNDMVSDTPMLSVFDKQLDGKTGQQKLETIAKPMLARYFLLGKKMGVNTEDIMGEGNARLMQTDKTYLDDVKNYMGYGDLDGEVTGNDRKEFLDLHNKLGIIMPMLLINKIPIQDEEDKPVDILKKSGISMTPALATMNQTGQQKTNTLNDILALANITPDDLTQDALTSINTKMKKYGWTQDLAQMGGSTISIIAPMMLAEAGAGFAIESLALNPRTATIANFLLKNPIGKIVKGGATYSLGGTIAGGDGGKELDFGTGGAAGVVDVVLDALGSKNKAMAKWFISTFGKRATKFAAIAAKPIAKGVGEFFQESGETIYQAWRDTPEGKSVMDTLQQQFPDADSQLKFFAGTVIMGGGMGLAGDIGFSGAKKRAYDALSPENKAKADAFMATRNQKAKDAVDEVVPTATTPVIEKNAKDAGEAKEKLEKIANRDVEAEDKVIADFQQRTGYEPTLVEDVPKSIDTTLSRIDNGLPVDQTAKDELADWAYEQYKKLSLLKKSDARKATTGQIQEAQDYLEGIITNINDEITAKKIEAEKDTDGTAPYSIEVNGVTYSGSTPQELQADIDFLNHVENTANDELYKRNTGQTQTPPIEPSAVDTEPTGVDGVGVEGEVVPEADNFVSNLKDDEDVTITVATLDEVPAKFKDRAIESKERTADVQKSFLGIPYGKKETRTVKEKSYTYTATGKEIKDEYNATKPLIKETPEKVNLDEGVVKPKEQITEPSVSVVGNKYKTERGSFADVEKEGDKWHIEYIEAKKDRQGDGTAIVNKIIEDAKKSGVSEITLVTGEGTALGFFEKLGFKEQGENLDRQDVLMALELSPTKNQPQEVEVKETVSDTQVSETTKDTESQTKSVINKETPIIEDKTTLKTEGLPDLNIVPSKESSSALEAEIGGDKGVIDADIRTIPIQEYDVTQNNRSEQIAEQISDNGWIEPLIVSYDKNGDVYIVEGQHRAAALKQLGYDKAPVIVISDKNSNIGKTIIGSKEATPTEKVEAEPTADINNVADKAGISPKNLRDLYNINRTLFGLNKVKSLAAAVAIDRMVGVMAKRAGITKSEMYARLEFKKDTEANVLKADNALFQGTVNGENVTLRNTDVDVVNGFYSPLRKIIAEAKQDKMPAKQWIEKFAKGEEAKWTGLTDWLAAQQGSISKADILDYLKNNRISIVEVVKEDSVNSSGKNQIQSQAAWILLRNGDAVYDRDGNAITKDTFGTVNEYFADIEVAKAGDIPKFSQYQLEGDKSNYKEVLVTLPNNAEKRLELLEDRQQDEIDRLRGEMDLDKNNPKDYYFVIEELSGKVVYLGKNEEDRNAWYNENISKYDDLSKVNQTAPSGIKSAEEYDSYFNPSSPILDKLDTQIKQAEKKATDITFKSSHFDEPNILVHLRMNTRTDADGNKVLFLEEIQSDWGQKGKKEGFSTAPTKSYVIKGSNGEILAEAPTKEGLEDIFDYYKQDDVGAKIEELISTNRPLSGDSKTIPTAPFVTDTNAWVKLGLKVAMKEAVAQGATKIAWTTGEQQNDRYDLSKQVDKISVYRSTENGERTINPLIYLKGGSQVDILVDGKTGVVIGVNKGSDNLKGQTLHDVIGKDIADKILESKNGFDEYEGEGLKVGGKGMKGFYGSPTEGSLGIVGNAAKSLFKQDVGTVDINANDKTTQEKIAAIEKKREINGARRAQINKEMPQKRAKNKAEQELIDKYVKEYKELSEEFHQYEKDILALKSTQNSITITPELRTQVQNGLALFQKQQGQNAKGAMVAADGKFIIYALTDPNVTTPLHEVAHVFEHYLTDSERATVNNWAKTGAWTTETSEKFARGFEKYLSEGIAPTEGLKKVFEKFKTWLTDIYNGIKGSDIDIELNDDMRSIYAQMLGKDAVPTKKSKAAPKKAKKAAIQSDVINKLVGSATDRRAAVEAIADENIKEVAKTVTDTKVIDKVMEAIDNNDQLLADLEEKLGMKKICKVF